MILRDHVPCHLSLTGLLGTGLLGLLAFPAWSAPIRRPRRRRSRPSRAPPRRILHWSATMTPMMMMKTASGTSPRFRPNVRPATPPAPRETQLASNARRNRLRPRPFEPPSAKGKKPTDSADKAETSKGGLASKRELIRKLSLDLTGKPPTPAEVEAFLADDSPQATPKLVERLLARAAKSSEPGNVRNKPGSDRDLEKSHREVMLQHQRALSKEKSADVKPGPGPGFEKSMNEMGRKLGMKMTEKFGPGSDFEKKMEAMGKEMAEKLGPGSEFEAKMKEIGKLVDQKVKSALETGKGGEASAPKPSPDARPKPKASPRPAASARSREARIKELESKLDQIRDELKRLKEGNDDSLRQ